MFSQSADGPATDQSPAPIGMRELPPQPAKPVMPAYATTSSQPLAQEAAPGPDDSVIAKDDHLEGTFTSRGTVVVMGSVKGRIEAVQVRIEDGATVDADVIVDEAIIAGAFTGNLTCRQRLEARPSGRINGRVETHKLMLHEGASVEGEMHMLAETPRDASETIRGSAPLRGEGASEARTEAKVAAVASTSSATTGPATPGPATSASSMPAPAATRPAPSITPSSSAKPSTSAVSTTATGSTAPATTTATPATPPVEATAVRSSVAAVLRAESMRVAPRTTTTARGYGGSVRTTSSTSNGRSGTTTSGF
jgi:cytoskeletal protein CcmA (bactofilin family)